MERDYLVFGKPDIGEAEKQAVREVLDSGWLSTGSKVKEFEREFEKHVGMGHAVAVSSCTDGLVLSLIACGVGMDDEVITSPLTFAATVNAILSVGANVIFADVNASGLLDPESVEGLITERTRAIIPVHYKGLACDMDAFSKMALEHDLFIIEDAAHAFDGRFVNNKHDWKIGSISDFTCFSFYATKNITCGEGGMVMVRDHNFADEVRLMSMQGLSADAYKRYGKDEPKQYQVITTGMKSNLSDVHAAIGLAQLRRWPELKKKREAVWSVYEKAFGKKTEEGHAKHLFTIPSPDRDGLRRFLHQNGIGTGIHFNPLHLEPAYQFMGHKRGDFIISELIGSRTVSLPLSATMTEEDAHFVVDKVLQFDHRVRERCK